MRSKNLTLTLALLAGSAGADRFYLGRNNAGWIILVLFWLLLPAVIYGVIRFNLVPNWEPVLLAKYALPLMFHVYAAGRYMVMSKEKFMSQNSSKGNFPPLTALSVVIAAILAVGASRMLAEIQVVDIESAKINAVLSAEQMSQEYRNNEEKYRKDYENKVLQIQGIVAETGQDFEAGTYFALQGKDGDPFGIKCFFLGENLSAANNVKVGDTVVIKGVANGNKLENSKLMSINGKKLP